MVNENYNCVKMKFVAELTGDRGFLHKDSQEVPQLKMTWMNMQI